MKKKLTLLLSVVLAVGFAFSFAACINKTQLSKPTDLTINGTVLSWKAVENATDYVVDYGSENVFTTNNTYFDFVDLASGDYTFKVKAKGDSNKYTDSDWSEGKAHTVLPKLVAPTSLGLDGAYLYWEEVENAQGYLIEYAVSGGQAQTLNATDTSYDLGQLNLQAGTYSFKVAAKGNGTTHSNSAWSTAVNHTIAKLATPAPTVSGNTLSWAEVANADGYEIELTKDSVVTSPNQIVYENSFDLTALGAGSYSLKVRAIAENFSFITSDYSAAAAYTVDTKLAAPTAVAANGAGVVTWDIVLRATSYTIKIEQDGVEVGSPISGITSTSHTIELEEGTYDVFVKASADGYDDSDYSTKVQVTLLQRLQTPWGLGYNNATKTLTWAPVDGAIGYIVDVEGAKYNTTDESFDVSVLAVGEYNVMVRAKGDGTTMRDSEYSELCLVEHSTILAAPELELISGKLAWTMVADAIAYEIDIDGYAVTVLQEDLEDENYPEIVIADFVDEGGIPYFYKAGVYTISVRALADTAQFYADSDLSNTVSYSIAATAGLEYTEVVKDDVVVGYLVSVGTAADTGVDLTIKLPSYHNEKPILGVTSAQMNWDLYRYEGGFAQKTNIAQLLFGHNTVIETIGDYAFYGCYGLNAIHIPASVTSIGSYAFAECYISDQIWQGDELIEIKGGIETVIFEGSHYNDDLTIGDYAFNKNRALSYVELSGNVVSIGNYAFAGQNTYSPMDLANIVFSSFSRLEAIGNYAFAYCPYLSFVVLPATLQSLGEGAFEGCYTTVWDASYTVEIPYGLMVVVFHGSATDPDFTLGANAFKDCSMLTTVILPANTVSIGAGAFTNTAVTDYQLNPGGNTFATDINGFLYTSDMSTLVSVPANTTVTDFVVPATVTTIADAAFYGNQAVETVTFESGSAILSISVDAFRSSSLKSIVLADSITSIGENAFRDCASLSSVTFSADLETIAAGAFYNSAITQAILPEGLLSMGNTAFQNCAKLTKVVVPSSLSTLPTAAFRGCSTLNDITLNEGLEEIGENAFYQAGNAAGVEPKSVVFPSSLLRILASAFYQAKFISGYSFNNNTSALASIGNNAFNGCSNLATMSIPASVTTLGNSVFSNCTSLTTVALPNTVESIGTGLFSYCSNLESATLNLKSTITTLPNETFRNCEKLAEVSIPDTITTLGNYAFTNNKALHTINIPLNLATINQNAFQNCLLLTTLTLPNVVTLGASVFDGSGITSLSFGASLATTNATSFANMTSLAQISVDGANAAFKTADNVLFNKEGTKLILYPVQRKVGGEYATAYTIDSNVTQIEANAFKGNTSLVTINIPATVTAIGANAFENCTALTAVSLPTAAGFTAVSNYLFAGCTSLASISIPTNITSIGTNAFQKSALTSISLSSALTSIGANAFQEVPLISVTIPKSVTSIGNYAFDWNSTSAPSPLTTLTFEGGRTANLTIGTYAFRYANITTLILPEKVTSIGANAFNSCKSLTTVVIPTTVTSIGSNAFANCETQEGSTYTGGIESFYIQTTAVLSYGYWFSNTINRTSGKIYFVSQDVLDAHTAHSSWTYSNLLGYFAVGTYTPA